ncbi:hypothetical protein D3C85_1155060 [compost metagenome]
MVCLIRLTCAVAADLTCCVCTPTVFTTCANMSVTLMVPWPRTLLFCSCASFRAFLPLASPPSASAAATFSGSVIRTLISRAASRVGDNDHLSPAWGGALMVSVTPISASRFNVALGGVPVAGPL